MQARLRARKTITPNICESRRDLRSLPEGRDLLSPGYAGLDAQVPRKDRILLTKHHNSKLQAACLRRIPPRPTPPIPDFAAAFLVESIPPQHDGHTPRSHHREYRTGKREDDCGDGHGSARRGPGNASADAAVPERLVALRGIGRGKGLRGQ